MKKILFFLFLISSMWSCLSPEDTRTSADTDIQILQELIASQKEKIIDFSLEKEITTEKGSSKKRFKIDSTFFERDFEILDGKDFGQIFHQNTYEKTDESLRIRFVRKKGEKKGPLYLEIKKDTRGKIRSISIKEIKDNLLFRSEVNVSYFFDQNQSLQYYSIEGNQKLIGMAPSRYQIKGTVKIN